MAKHKKIPHAVQDSACPKAQPAKTDYRSELPAIVDQLVASCATNSCFEHIGAEPLPSRQHVIEILDSCRDVLFPGYFRNQGIDTVDLPYQLGLEVSRLYDRLTREITRAIRHECLRHGTACQHCEAAGKESAFRFLETLPALRAILATDVRAAYNGDPAAGSMDEIIFSYPGIQAIMVYRIAHELSCLEIPILPRIMSEHAHALTGIDIHPGANIGESFFIDHGTGVVIGQTSVIGNRVRIYQGVTLGALSFKRDETGNLDRQGKRHPTLEDDVVVYAGSTILGGDTVIGARSVIGGNTWLTQSVPPDTKVMLKSPELIMKTSRSPKKK
ncbi:MAG: serine O-acetyltransferase EpsC [Thermodesulfobacteriota bacterium]